ncbi:hypothetical protein KC221_28935, partial [Mycobacterium tuberculosis]|nr:hypothetical protein [Mycobacterium tuberculosis]
MDDHMLAEIADLVRDELADALGGVQIETVHVTEDISRDDDSILRVDIVCRGRPEDIDTTLLSKAIV